MSESETETRAAFITAAFVLLVMPLLYVVGLAAIFLAMRFSPWAETRGAIVALAVIWGVVVIVSVLMLARRLIRRLAND